MQRFQVLHYDKHKRSIECTPVFELLDENYDIKSNNYLEAIRQFEILIAMVLNQGTFKTLLFSKS